MGLSGHKNKTKLSQDPNNTAWSRSTTNFGHKILAAQGWKPGEYLGAKDAKHSDYYTAANASHIRVMLREDNLGLGAQVGKGNAETFGLSMFSGLLGRLNGKDQGEIQKQEGYRRDAELATYQSQKYGFMNFVRGGLLLGDKMEFPDQNKISKSASLTSKDRKRKKPDDNDKTVEESTLKRKKGKSDLKAEAMSSAEGVAEDTASSSSAENVSVLATNPSTNVDASKAKSREASQRRREERRARKAAKFATPKEEAAAKEAKRALKEERRKRKLQKRSKDGKRTDLTSNAVDPVITAPPKPATPSGPALFAGRQAVRQRYIQQKRMASMDPKALKEIFMLQAAS